MSEVLVCEHCGKQEREEYGLEIYHRACRLKAAFPDAVVEHERGLVALDVSKLAALMAHPKAVTRDGVEFERWDDGRVSISVGTQVGNNISAWTWWLRAEEWEAVIAAMREGVE